MGGRVVHFEIPYDDAGRAQAFYEQTFGWRMQPLPEMGYVLVETGPNGEAGPEEPGFINGGMMQRSADFQTPDLVVDVDNLEDAIAAAESAGGHLVQGRQPVGDMGFTAYVRDTEGNVVGLWETAPQG